MRSALLAGVLTLLVAPTPVAAASPDGLLELVPEQAVGVAALRPGAMSWLRSYLDSNPPMRAELGGYLERVVGIDFTKLESAVLFSSNLGTTPTGAALLRVPGAAAFKLHKKTSYEGIDVVELAPDLVGAVGGKGIVVVGQPAEVQAALAAIKGKAGRLDAHSRLAPLLKSDSKDLDLLIAADATAIGDPTTVAQLQRFGVQRGTLWLRSDGNMALELQGDPAGLQTVQATAAQLGQTAVQLLEQRKNEAAKTDNVAEAIGAISSFHLAKALFTEVQPKMEGDKLVSRYKLPKGMTATTFASYAGLAAALAIPAFRKYAAKAKTAESRSSLRRIGTGAIAWREANRKRGKQFAFPPSTDWTPQQPCCSGEGGKCAADPKAFQQKSWQALQFTFEEPHYFQYRFTSQGKGANARFVAESRGDPQCDGNPTVLRLEGLLDPQGNVTLKGLDDE